MCRLIFAIIIIGAGFFAHNAEALAQMQLSNISDFSLGNWGMGDPAVSSSMDLCVGSLLNSPAGGYAITITSSTGAYTLKSGSNTLPYTLFWDSSGSGSLGSGSTQLTNGMKLSGLGNGNALSALCALGLTGPNARLTIKIAQSDLTAAIAGTYSGTITMLLSPN
jgi:hypothetical protein